MKSDERSTTPIRVLLVDDMFLVRKIVRKEIEKHPGIIVTQEATNGVSVIEKMQDSEFDIVILDVEMPVMNGLETLERIRKTDTKTPIIMFSTLTEKGALTTLEALGKGATDFVAKPTSTDEGSFRKVIDVLVSKILGLSKITHHVGKKINIASSRREGRAQKNRKLGIVAIGASTGGPNALQIVFSEFKTPPPVPIVVTQHMPAMFTKILADKLDSISCVAVCEAEDGMDVLPGHAYIAPGGKHLTFSQKGKIKLNPEGTTNSCRPSVDDMVNSLVNFYRGEALGVMLTGMGADGAKSFKTLSDLGAPILVQDEKTSVIWSMPRNVLELTHADRICSIHEIANEILSYFSEEFSEKGLECNKK